MARRPSSGSLGGGGSLSRPPSSGGLARGLSGSDITPVPLGGGGSGSAINHAASGARKMF